MRVSPLPGKTQTKAEANRGLKPWTLSWEPAFQHLIRPPASLGERYCSSWRTFVWFSTWSPGRQYDNTRGDSNPRDQVADRFCFLDTYRPFICLPISSFELQSRAQCYLASSRQLRVGRLVCFRAAVGAGDPTHQIFPLRSRDAWSFAGGPSPGERDLLL